MEKELLTTHSHIMVSLLLLTIASIPLAAVERIEVLTSGASSIYGSDAVAGVVNIILVDGLEDKSFRVVAGGGIGSGTGGENINLNLLAVVSVIDLPTHMHLNIAKKKRFLLQAEVSMIAI